MVVRGSTKDDGRLLGLANRIRRRVGGGSCCAAGAGLAGRLARWPGPELIGNGWSALTVSAVTEGHLRAVRWAAQWESRKWAIEDCRHISRRLEADLLAAGEMVVRVPPKMMAAQRRSARTRGKSDPIDALAVARAALREPDLPVASLDGPAREVKLLVDYRERLVRERTGAQNSLRWRLTNWTRHGIRRRLR